MQGKLPSSVLFLKSFSKTWKIPGPKTQNLACSLFSKIDSFLTKPGTASVKQMQVTMNCVETMLIKSHVKIKGLITTENIVMHTDTAIKLFNSSQSSMVFTVTL